MGCDDRSLRVRATANAPPDAGAPQAPSSSKLGVHQIVRLRQMVQQWRRRAATNIDRTLRVMSPHRAKKLLRGLSSSGRSSSPSSSEREVMTSSRENECEFPPEGYLAIYVGQEQRRFLIRTEHINHPLLRGLLERTEEDFGLNHQGGLTIPACEVVLFEHILWMVENQDVHALDDPVELREIVDFYLQVGPVGNGSSCCLQEAKAPNNNMLAPASAMSCGYATLHH